MTWRISLEYNSYEEACQEFSWQIPSEFNAATDLVGKHDEPEKKPALIEVHRDGRRREYTFDDLDIQSDEVANGLSALGVERGDRVGVMASQRVETLLVHLACWKIGAISVPLSVLFGRDALHYRLEHSGATAVVLGPAAVETFQTVRDNCPAIESVIEIESGVLDDARMFKNLLDGSRHYPSAETDADTPAILMYTSGSTGNPKGVLHAHDVWLGRCPAASMYFEGGLTEEAICWTPADWSWIGALGDLVFPAWHYGRPVIAYPMEGFDPQRAFEVLSEFEITHAVIPPTAIRMMMNINDPTERFELALEVIAGGGEAMTPEISDWATEELGDVTVNEFYGQTEASLVVTTRSDWFEPKSGSIGKPVPGYDVAIIDSKTGEEVPTGEIGEIAIRRGAPGMARRYWCDSETTEKVMGGEWHLTGDLAIRDLDGYIQFKSRDDDLIITSGYRVNPNEVEQSILEHKSVEQVGVIGVPNETRGKVIKAFIQPTADVTRREVLREDVREHVRNMLADYEYPREIEFIDDFPRTPTGKIDYQALEAR